MAKKAHDQQDLDRFERTEEAQNRLLTLIRQIPTEVFTAMASRSGLPTKESRELCLAFKALKG